MNTIKIIILILFIITLILFIAYTKYMTTKKGQFPKVTFSGINTTPENIECIEHLVNRLLREVNGWMWLSTAFLSAYYFINFWSIAFMLLNIVVIAFKIEGYEHIVLFLASGSMLFTCIDLWINTKEKSIQFHKQWFNTFSISRHYIIKLLSAKTYDELCTIAIEFNMLISYENKKVNFL